MKPKPKAVNKPSPHFIVHGLDKPGVFTTVSEFLPFAPAQCRIEKRNGQIILASLLSEGRQYIKCYTWLTTYAGLSIMLAVLAFNLMGDALRDLLDPRLRGE